MFSLWRWLKRFFERRTRSPELVQETVIPPTPPAAQAGADPVPLVTAVHPMSGGIPAQRKAKEGLAPGNVSHDKDDNFSSPGTIRSAQVPNGMQEISQGPALNSTLTGEHTDTPGLVGPEHQGQQVDPPSHLQISCEQATRYTDNLNGQVTLLEGRVPVRGSSALVYQGILRREAEEVKVAVKIFHSGQPGDTTVLKGILREVHICSQLRHANVICMLGVSTDFGATLSIISRWMEMGDAHTFVQNTDHDPRPLLLDIARGLNYLHTLQTGAVFHGDLKGFNVLVSEEHTAVLANFGLSIMTGSPFNTSTTTSQRGSLPWMAPEFLDNYSASAAGDVWAFGMTVLELFTRTAPYPEHPHTTDIVDRISKGPLPNRPTNESSCFRMTDVWWDICASCWKREPPFRPTTSEILKKIQDIVNLAPPELENNMPSPLNEVFDKAIRYSMNLNGQVHLDEREGSAPGRPLVCQGILAQEKGQRRVAVKATRLTSPGDLNTLRSILRVVHLWSKLHHQNIVGLLGITTDFGPTISIVSEWIGRGDAHTYVQDRGNDPQPLLLDIANGLHYLHSHELDICHGDIRGSSVLVSDDRRALLSEFGHSTLTKCSLSMGMDVNAPQRSSFAWMAPEILIGNDVLHASDVWAFGMTVLELFTRLPPYHDCTDLTQRMSKITNGQLPDRPSEELTCRRMTDAWWELILSCCTHEPSLRPSMSTVLEKMKEIMPIAPPTKMENDIFSILNAASQSAADYSLNLDGQVRLDEENTFLRGTYAFVRRGILYRGAERIKVAVKTFHGSPNDAKTLKQILREVHTCSKLHCDQIVRMLGISTDFNSTISIISEWMEMGNARSYVQNVENDPRPLLLDIASALHYLHTREDGPIFHGDLKGANVLVSSDRRALLCDFGLSTLTQSSFSVSANSAHNGGSLPWMAPEVLDNHPISAASDIWSFGMTTLELFTCSDPYHGCKGIAPLIAKIAGGRLPRRPDVHGTHFRMTDAWWELCLSCWKHEPTLRLAISEVSEKIQTMISSGVQT